MNGYPKISVIVPVYNTEKYLCRCIDSILAQDFTDFELILVDDGSKDKSGLICDEYAPKDNRVKVYHKENGGVSSARNLGLDKAQGEFITFIDSDDYVDSNYLTILMRGGEADLVATGYINTYYPDIKYSFQDSVYELQRINICLASQLDQEPFRTPWGKRFKLTIIKKYTIKFDTYISFAEDTIFIQNYLIYCNSIALRNGMPYHYRVEQDNEYFFKHPISSKEYINTLNIISDLYNKISKQFGFTCPEYCQNTNKYIIIQYFCGIIQKRYTLAGYHEYKQTMQLMLPDAKFSNRLYKLVYKLLKGKYYFLSFLVLRFIYPLKVNLTQNIHQHKTPNRAD